METYIYFFKFIIKTINKKKEDKIKLKSKNFHL